MPERTALQLASFLQYYKRREVQEAILRHAGNREVSPRYGEGFGKRPDVLLNPQDVLEFAKRKATSFHVSEERWDNPLLIQTGMSRQDANALRTGWDLVLDIDAKDWGISRLTAWLFVQALRAHGISGISVKFSGNKGWHVGVPFEAFPLVMLDAQERDVPTKDLFPELPRAIATYLVQYIGSSDNELIAIDNDVITFGNDRTGRRIKGRLSDFAKKAGKPTQALIETRCAECDVAIEAHTEGYFLLCPNPSCQYRDGRRYSREEKEGIDYRELECPRCRKMRDFELLTKRACPHMGKPGMRYKRLFKIDELIEFDTVLLASRHLYRMPYSLHEKSGLASAVVDPDAVLTFSKSSAKPGVVDLSRTFLDPAEAIPGEAAALAHNAWAAFQRKEEKRASSMQREFEIVEDAIPEEHFPPCIQRILEGLPDGKKRAMFALTNFLTVCGWSHEMIEKRLFEWNARNPEPLREVVIRGHLRSLRMKKERILPPNCKSFYQELGVCRPDMMCSTIRNPAQYTVKKATLAAPKKGRKAKKEGAPAAAPAPER